MGMSQGGMKGRSTQPQNPIPGLQFSMQNQRPQPVFFNPNAQGPQGGGSPGMPNTSQSGGFDPWAASRQQMGNMVNQASQMARPPMPLGGNPGTMGQNPAPVAYQPSYQMTPGVDSGKAPMMQGTTMPYQAPMQKPMTIPQPSQAGLSGAGLGPNYASPAVANTMPAYNPQPVGVGQPISAPIAATPQAQQLATALRASSKFGY